MHLLTQTSRLIEDENKRKIKEYNYMSIRGQINWNWSGSGICCVSFYMNIIGFLQRSSIYHEKSFYRCKQNFHAVVLLLTVLEVCLQWNGPSLGLAMSQYTGSVVEESLVTMVYRDCWVSVSSRRSLYWASRFVMEIGWNSVITYQISNVTCI